MELTELRRIKNLGKKALPGFEDGRPSYLDGIGMLPGNLSFYNTPATIPEIQMNTIPGVSPVGITNPIMPVTMKPADGVSPTGLIKPDWNAKPQLSTTTVPKSRPSMNAGVIPGAIMSTIGAVADIEDAHVYGKSVQNLLDEAGRSLRTAMGAGYEWQNDPEYQRELDEVRKSNTANTLKATGSGAAAGAAIGSIIPGLGTLTGGAIGGVVGAIGGLFGGASRKRKAEEKLRLAEINAKVRNDFNRDDALTRAIRELNAREIGNPFAATYKYVNGKTPIYGPPGYADGYFNSKVSSGETIGNLEEGWAYKVPGKPNNKDTKRAFLRDNDFVLTNKDGISALANLTGDYVGALNLLNMRNSYKNGKLPGFEGGRPIVDPMTSIIPSVFGGIAGLYLYFDAHNQNIFSPNTNKLNLYAQDAFAALNEIKNNPYPTLWQLREAEARTRNALDSSGGLGAGLKMLARIAQLGVTQSQWAKALADTQAYNNAQKMAVNNLKISTGESGANRSVQTDQWDKDHMFKAHAARQQGEQTGIYNFKNVLDTYYGMRFKENQLARMLGLYEQNQALDLARFNRDVLNSYNNPIIPSNVADYYNKLHNAMLNMGWRDIKK